MKSVRILMTGMCAVVLMACACNKGGKGSGQDGDFNNGKIPGPEAGSVLKDVNFAFDSAVLSETAKSTLKANFQWLSENSAQKFTVEGHCDERGTNEYNMALGERRARSTQDYYKNLGVTSDRMSTISYGEEIPLDNGHTEASWSKNRRAHHSFK